MGEPVTVSALGGPEDTEDDSLPEGVVIRCYMVQPRSLQECVIVYQSSAGGPGGAGASALPDAVSSQNGESLGEWGGGEGEVSVCWRARIGVLGKAEKGVLGWGMMHDIKWLGVIEWRMSNDI